MAITLELIKGQSELKDLTDAQIAALVQLSINDEDAVVGQRIGKIYGDLDNDIKETFSVEKKQGEKTYDYLKRVGKSIVEQITELGKLKQLLADAEAAKKTLEKQVAEGKGNELISQQLKDAEKKLKDITQLYEAEKEEKEKTIKGFDEKMLALEVDREFDKAFVGIEVKPELSGMKDYIFQTAKGKILAEYKPDFVVTANSKVLVFRNDKNEIVSNPGNKLNPFTVSELVKKELAGVMQVEKGGGGTKAGGSAGGSDFIDLSAAKTQVEANAIIIKHLLQKGLVKGTLNFDLEQKKLIKDHKINELRIK